MSDLSDMEESLVSLKRVRDEQREMRRYGNVAECNELIAGLERDIAELMRTDDH